MFNGVMWCLFVFKFHYISIVAICGNMGQCQQTSAIFSKFQTSPLGADNKRHKRHKTFRRGAGICHRWRSCCLGVHTVLCGASARTRQHPPTIALVHVDTIRYLLMEVDGSAREISRKYQQISAIIGKQNASRITLDCPMKYYDIF